MVEGRRAETIDVAVVLIFLATALGVPADGPEKSAGADEVDSHLESTRRILADASRPVEERASLALEEAAALDREAQIRPDLEGRRARSSQAVRLLDEFNAAHPGHGLCIPLALQAGVYVWADGRREMDGWRLHPADDSRKGRAAERLDESIRRLQRLEPELSGVDPIVAQNARFRLAQALADRAGLASDASPEGRDWLKKALAAIDPIPTESAVEGFARLLHAEILARLGELNRAEDEINAASRLKQPPPIPASTEVRVRILAGQGRYLDALKAIDSAGLDDVARDAMALEVRLEQRRGPISGPARTEAEVDAFGRARSLRGSERPEARRALNDLGRSLDQPPPHAEPEAWDTLADAALGLGDASRASRLVASAADRARTLGQPEEAARLRYRAGAILFQAGDYAGADPLLGRVWDDPKAGPSRPKAGMLRALARGRALADGQPGATRAAYLDALRDVVRSYPDEPATVEARWLLASAEAEDGHPPEAVGLWRSIPGGHPRWLLARLAIAAQYQRELDDLRIGDETTSARAKFREAAAFLRESTRLASGPAEVIELDLASARLDLTPGVGRPELARSLCDRIAHEAGSAAQHARARIFRLVALAMTQRITEAEKEIRGELTQAPPEALLAAARLLDHAADAVDSDAGRLRFGRLIRIITDGLARRADLPSALAAELRLRAVRAAIFTGDLEAARRLFRGDPPLDPGDYDLDGLRDLSDAFLRLDAPGMAVEVERLRARRLKPGSAAWLESRYVLALALYRDRKADDARDIIDATAILHPDLGGGSLRPRFERLRQRIDQE